MGSRSAPAIKKRGSRVSAAAKRASLAKKSGPGWILPYSRRNKKNVVKGYAIETESETESDVEEQNENENAGASASAAQPNFGVSGIRRSSRVAGERAPKFDVSWTGQPSPWRQMAKARRKSVGRDEEDDDDQASLKSSSFSSIPAPPKILKSSSKPRTTSSNNNNNNSAITNNISRKKAVAFKDDKENSIIFRKYNHLNFSKGALIFPVPKKKQNSLSAKDMQLTTPLEKQREFEQNKLLQEVKVAEKKDKKSAEMEVILEEGASQLVFDEGKCL